MRRTVLAVAVCVATAGCGMVDGEATAARPAEAYLLELKDTLAYPELLQSKEFQKNIIEMGWKACDALRVGVPEAELHEITDFEYEPVIPAARHNFCPEEA